MSLLRLSIALLILQLLCSVSLLSNDLETNPKSHYLFEENLGQLPGQVLYSISLGDKNIYIEKDRIRWHLFQEEELGQLQQCRHDHSCGHESPVQHHVFDMIFSGSKDITKHKGTGKSFRYKNYFRGNDSNKWAGHVYSYSTIELFDVYDNIDIKMYISENGIKYDWIIRPGGDPSDISITYEGLNSLNLTSKGIKLFNSVENISETTPFSYQEVDNKRNKIESHFQLNANKLNYFIGKYNKTKTLIIDPELIFSTYSGSTADNWGSTATPGINGEFYGGGISFDYGYPITTGAFQENIDITNSPPGLRKLTDITITKFTPDGSNIIYSTYLGGSNPELAHSLIENSQGELVILGTSSSDNYPTTNAAYQQNFNGGFRVEAPGVIFEDGTDIVVTVLSADGSQLIGSTYIGGSSNDGINTNSLIKNYGDDVRGEVIVDVMDNIYIASSTQSSNFPIKDAKFSTKSNGQDACVFSLNRTCSELRMSSFLGGNGHDAAYTIKLVQNGNIAIAGGTQSTDIPTKKAIQNSHAGGTADGFIALFSNSLDSLVSCTYIGTPEYDQVYFLDMGPDESIYIAGQSEGGMKQTSNIFSNPGSSQFIQKLDSIATSIELATNFGSGRATVDISLTAFLVDRCGRVYISGWGGELNNPESSTEGLQISPDAIRARTDGKDFYFLVLEDQFEELLYATFFGRDSDFSRDHVDGGTSRFSDKGVIYQAVCAGCGASSDFPTTPGSWSQINRSNNCNLGAIKIDFELSRIKTNAFSQLDVITCEMSSVHFGNFSQGADRYLWTFGDGTTSTEYEPTHDYNSTGTYEVILVAYSDKICIPNDTIHLQIVINPLTEIVTDSIDECMEDFLILESRKDTNTTYLWNDNSTQKDLVIDQSGIYSVTATEGNCEYIDSFYIELANPESLTNDTFLCDVNRFVLTVDPLAENPSWSTGETANQIEITNSGVYTVSYQIGNCYFLDTASVNLHPLPNILLNGDSLICKNDLVTLKVDIDHSENLYEILWSNGETNNSIQTTEEGVYIVSVLSETPCYHEFRDTIILIEIGADPTFLDTTLCDEQVFLLSTPSDASFPNWSSGETTNSINVQSTNNYFVDYLIDGCPLRDSFNINFLSTPSYSLGQDTSLCQGESLTLRITEDGNISADSILWSTSERSSSIEIDSAGTYSVELVREGDCPFQIAESILISFIESNINLPDTTICANLEIPINIDIQADKYLWSTGETTSIITISQAGEYSVEYHIAHCIFNDTFQLFTEESIDLKIHGQDYLCGPESIELSVTNSLQGSNLPVLWSTQDSTEFIEISAPGLYSVRINTDSECHSIDTIEINHIPLIDLPNYLDTLLCGEDVYLEIDLRQYEGFSNIEWQDGYRSNIRNITESGEYSFRINNSCQDFTREIVVEKAPHSENKIPIYIPNAFTPNEDGVNDIFKAEIADDLELINYHMLIFDRWGNKIFESFELKHGWDGRFKGLNMDPAIFIYVIKATVKPCLDNKEIILKGNINLQK